MAWNDRIREAAYNSPSGIRLVFGGYENVSKSFDKKTTGFEFPDANGTYVQDLGHTGRRYPLRVFFWGDDYDEEAAAFEAALMETGIGKLEHPIYGTVNVVPYGTINQRDDLKTAANQAVIEVTFWETIDLIYPSAQSDPGADVLTGIDDYNTEAANEFEDVIDLDSAAEQVTFKNVYQSLIDNVSSGLEYVADTQDDVSKQFDAIVNSINTGIDVLIADPLTLAFQTTLMIQAPARAATSIEARLDGYSNLATSIINSPDAIAIPGNDSRNSNTFRINNLYASTYITGLIVAVVNNQFTTKPEALAAAETIIDLFDDIKDWQDDNFESLSEIDKGGSYQQLQKVVALAAGFLVEISFSLKQEKRLVLDRARTIIDLVAELYGDTDDLFDFFITSNNLTGSEILEIPRGREIVYYI